MSHLVRDLPFSFIFANFAFIFDRHGRTAMLAVVGFIATDFVRLPGDMYSFSSIPKTVDAHNKLIEDGPMVQLLMWIGLWELIVTAPAIVATMNGERTPGGE